MRHYVIYIYILFQSIGKDGRWSVKHTCCGLNRHHQKPVVGIPSPRTSQLHQDSDQQGDNMRSFHIFLVSCLHLRVHKSAGLIISNQRSPWWNKCWLSFPEKGSLRYFFEIAWCFLPDLQLQHVRGSRCRSWCLPVLNLQMIKSFARPSIATLQRDYYRSLHALSVETLTGIQKTLARHSYASKLCMRATPALSEGIARRAQPTKQIFSPPGPCPCHRLCLSYPYLAVAPFALAVLQICLEATIAITCDDANQGHHFNKGLKPCWNKPFLLLWPKPYEVALRCPTHQTDVLPDCSQCNTGHTLLSISLLLFHLSVLLKRRTGYCGSYGYVDTHVLYCLVL